MADKNKNLGKTSGDSCLLSKKECSETKSIEKDYSEKNVFLNIPHEDYRDHEDVLREILSRAGLSPVTAKSSVKSEQGLCEVCRLIRTCKYGISDISYSMHSITYKAGLIDGLGKPACILMQERTVNPDDVEGLGYMWYRGERGLKIVLAEWLRDNIRESDKESLKSLVMSENELMSGKGEGELYIPDKFREKKEYKPDKTYIDNAIKTAEKNFRDVLGDEAVHSFRTLTAVPNNNGKRLVAPEEILDKVERSIVFRMKSINSFPLESESLKMAEDRVSASFKMKIPAVNKMYFKYFENDVNGFVYLKENIYEQKNENINEVISSTLSLSILYKFLLYILNFYREAGYTRDIHFRYKLENVMGRQIHVKDNNNSNVYLGRIRTDDIIAGRNIDLNRLKEDGDNIILGIFEDIRFRSGMEEPFKRDITKWNLEEVKMEIYGRDTCPACGRTSKPKNSNKCLNCIEKGI